MKTVNHIKMGASFLAFLGTPSYLIYDFNRILQGRTNFLHWLIFAGFLGVFMISALRLVRSKGEDYMRLKPLWERPAAFFMLILSAPLLVLVTLLIKSESPGPVVYYQERIGENRRKRGRRRTPSNKEKCSPNNRRKADRRERDLGGRPFIIYKLRSMTTDSEEKTGAAWSTGDRDPRVTKVGYYIRKVHVDELPQLLNVILGQMSLIGPRPERPVFVSQLSNAIPEYQERLRIPPGITGLAQVRQEHDESIDDVRRKLQHDREYIENISFLLDMQIISKTVVLISTLVLRAIQRRTIARVEPKASQSTFEQAPRWNADNSGQSSFS